jgi:hypothetical protein
MYFSNWLVTENSIEWNGDDNNTLVIPSNKLTELRKTRLDAPPLYEAVLAATDQDWLSQNDLYDLNYAFVFAIAKFNLEFDYQIFDDTLAEQFDLLDEEDRDDFKL